MDGAFEVGAQVQLKSGGPVMTVASELEFGMIACTWFEGTKVKTQQFAPEMLNRWRRSGPLHVRF